MSTIFYDHLIEWHKLDEALKKANLDSEERLAVLEHAEHVIHIHILKIIISHLPREKHEEFITRFHRAPHDMSNLHFIVSHATGDVESAIREQTHSLIGEIIKDLS